MSSIDLDDYPRGIFNTVVLNTTPIRVGTVDAEVKVKHVHLRGGAAAEIVIFQSEDGTQEYFRVSLSIDESVDLGPFSIRATTSALAGGLEVKTASSAGDVEVTVFYKTTVATY